LFIAAIYFANQLEAAAEKKVASHVCWHSDESAANATRHGKAEPVLCVHLRRELAGFVESTATEETA
jgi:hypothetical protein